MKILVLNSGSSSLKYELFAMPAATVLAAGIVERIGEPVGGQRHVSRPASSGERIVQAAQHMADHHRALDWILDRLIASDGLSMDDLDGIGHRVVHGGEQFWRAVQIDAPVVAAIRQLIPLAPLHNPANLSGIEVALRRCPRVPQVAVFDTAFHHGMPPHAYHYALPRAMYEEHGVRRYGFHGTSHDYVARQAAAHLQRPLESLDLITLHLGNGASAAAVRGGRCIDTSMGLTPLEGLMMGTRCGDMDPAVIFHLARCTGWSNDQIEELLNRESGLKGVAGVSDMRDVLRRAGQAEDTGQADEAGGHEEADVDKRDRVQARLAVDMYAYRVRKYIGAYLAALGRADAIVFTAGIGENSPEIREAVCSGLDALGIEIDPRANRADVRGTRAIHARRSLIRLLVVPTDEERSIAQQTLRVIQENAGQS